jgi:hypothetical protein
MFIRGFIVLAGCVVALMWAGCTRSSFAPVTKSSVSFHEWSAQQQQPARRTALEQRQTNSDYEGAVVLGNLEDEEIDESSGIVASRANPGLFWTHNDSGDDAFVYAFDRRGAKRGVWKVTGALAVDWEDIAIGSGAKAGTPYLYLGDIGDNDSKRAEIVVYRVAEPIVVADDANSNKRRPRQTERAEALRFRYPDGRHDAETLMVHPVTGDLYIISKIRFSAASVYKATAPLQAGSVTTLKLLGKINVPSMLGGMLTGGDISPDGRRVVLCDYVQGYELTLPEKGANEFDDIWKLPPVPLSLGTRQQGEGVCYRLDGQAMLATSEGRPSPLIEVLRRAAPVRQN